MTKEPITICEEKWRTPGPYGGYEVGVTLYHDGELYISAGNVDGQGHSLLSAAAARAVGTKLLALADEVDRRRRKRAAA